MSGGNDIADANADEIKSLLGSILPDGNIFNIGAIIY